MVFPKIGSRKISVDGVAYCWRIRKKATSCQADYGNGALHLAVQLATDPGATLVLFTDRPHPEDWGTAEVTPITPSDVAIWIRKAIELGWRPAAQGAQACFRTKGHDLEKGR